MGQDPGRPAEGQNPSGLLPCLPIRSAFSRLSTRWQHETAKRCAGPNVSERWAKGQRDPVPSRGLTGDWHSRGCLPLAREAGTFTVSFEARERKPANRPGPCSEQAGAPDFHLLPLQDPPRERGMHTLGMHVTTHPGRIALSSTLPRARRLVPQCLRCPAGNRAPEVPVVCGASLLPPVCHPGMWL